MHISRGRSEVFSIVNDYPGWLTRLESGLSTDGGHAESTELGQSSQGLSPRPSAGQSTSACRHWVGPPESHFLTSLHIG